MARQPADKGLLSAPRDHIEDPSIMQLAEAAGHTDEVAVGRQLFGWRELLSIVIPLILLGLVARNVDWGTAMAALRTANPWYVLAALVIYYATFPLRARRWARLLREGGLVLRGRDLLEILMLGWFVNCLAPAKLGDLYRSYLVKQRFNVSLSRTVGVVVAERLLDIFVVFALLLVGGYIAFGRTVLPDLRLVYLSAIALAVFIVIAFLAVYYLAPRLGRFFPSEVRRIGRLFREGVIHSFRALPEAGPETVVIWLAEAARLAFVLAALRLELPISGVIFVAVASSLLTTVPLTPAGFGFVELAVVYVLTTGFGLATHDAIAVAVLDRLVSVFSVIVIGGLLYARHRRQEARLNSPR
ncbi:MAG: lysylphosphatidylglycerol synthase transmembrane domain-containing protein [Chloroflexota bacterium]